MVSVSKSLHRTVMLARPAPVLQTARGVVSRVLPTDAQQAFDKYASAAILRCDRNLAHARDLHAVNVGLKEYKLRCAEGNDSSAAKSRLADMYRAVKDSIRQFEDDMKQLAERERKASKLLARALQLSWQPRSSSAFQAAVQHHGPPHGYGHRSSTAVF